MTDEVLYEVKKYIDMARETDYVMPLWLPYLPMIVILLGTIGFIVTESVFFSEFSVESESSALMGRVISEMLFSGLIIIGIILNFYVVYKWIERRNKHFRRTQGLWSAIINLLEYKGLNDPEVIAIKDAVNESRFEESEKSAIGWTIATLLPFVIYYVYHFLNKDFVKHERRELKIMQNLKSLLAKRGIYFDAPMFPSVKDRSTFLYIILTIVTLGIFAFYWIYTLTVDPNEHFRMHVVAESKLLRALEQL